MFHTSIRLCACALSLTAGLALLPGAAQAAVVVDQSVAVPASGNVAVVARVGTQPAQGGGTIYRSAIQSFTAGTAGILDHLDFQMAWTSMPNDGAFILSLYSGDLTAGPATLLFTDGGLFSSLPNITAARNGSMTTFDVRAANFAVTAGARYSVAFDAVPGPGSYSLIVGYGVGTPPNPPTIFGTNYAGGTLQALGNGSPLPGAALDIGFVSYVDTAVLAVPEPRTWAMLVGGFGLIGGAMRRRRTPVATAA